MNVSASQESGLKPDRGWRTLLMVSFHLVCWEGPCWKVPCAGRGTLRSFSCCCIWSSSKWRWTSRYTTSPTGTRKTSSWLEIRTTRNFSFWRWWCSQLHCPLLIISFKISNLTLASYLNRICCVCRVGIHKTSMFHEHSANTKLHSGVFPGFCSGARCVWEPPVCSTRGFAAGVSGRGKRGEVPRLRPQRAAGQCQTRLWVKVRSRHFGYI